MKVKLTHGATKLIRGTKFSSGLDLKARGVSRIVKKDDKNKIGEPKWFNDDFKSFKIKPMERVLVKTGIQVELDKPEEDENGNLFIEELNIRPRSGLSLKNGVMAILGTIDNDYTNDVGVILINLSTEDVIIKEDDRVGQMVTNFAVIDNNIKYVDEINATDRLGGFGHTGK